MPRPRRRLVIVGASFAGLHLARELSGLSDLVDIVLVEPNATVEYTPGILACLVAPAHAEAVVFDLKRAIPARVRLMQGRVTSVQLSPTGIGGTVSVSAASTDAQAPAGLREETVSWDWCVIATGSTYPTPMKVVDNAVGSHSAVGTTLSGRLAQLRRSAAEIAAAPSVLVVGGGPVGVELAAEVAVAFPAKPVTLLSAAATLMQGLPPALGEAAERWLVRRGVRVVLGQRVVKEAPLTAAEERPAAVAKGGALAEGAAERQPLLPRAGPGRSGGTAAGSGSSAPAAPGSAGATRTVLTDAGARFPAALVFTCAGAAPASAFCAAAASSPALTAALDARGRVRVDLCLRVVGCGPTLFAIGDVAGASGPR